MHKVAVVIPNWNGADELRDCLDSIRAQTLQPHIVVVDNGSTDSSVIIIETEYPEVELIKHTHNKGYAGGVNPGFKRVIALHLDFVATFNNDAVADKDWLRHLATYLAKHPNVGVAAAKILSSDGKQLDSSGEAYSIWGLPFPRGRDERDIDKYDTSTEILGASGGSSMYRVSMLKQVGLFDEDFFAYYEDTDLSLRAQLAGWKIAYVPAARTYHQISATSKKIKGFFTLQTVKNYPLLIMKDLPSPLLWRVLPRFTLAYLLILGRGVQRGNGRWVLQGFANMLWLLPQKFGERRQIQARREVTPTYLWELMTHDLPPNAHSLRRLRQGWWQLWGRV